MKTILKYSILYLVFATSTIFAHYHDKETVVNINTEEDLRNLLANSQGPSAISFHMDRCGWCIQMQPIFQDLAENDQFGHITFYRANGPVLKASTHAKDILNEQITGYPTIIFMNQGKVVDKQIGGTKKEVIAEKLNKLSSSPEHAKVKKHANKTAKAKKNHKGKTKAGATKIAAIAAANKKNKAKAAA